MKKECEVEIKPEGFKNLIKSWYLWKRVLPALTGALLGYLYYFFVGCSNGSCGITSNPWTSIATGSIFGYFLANSPCKNC